MRYFSPAVLDGSIITAKLADLAVTTAKLAALAVTRTKLNTLTNSQGGTIAAGGVVNVFLNPYSFFPDIETEAVGMELAGVQIAVPNASADSPSFAIQGIPIIPQDYDVAWRYVVA